MSVLGDVARPPSKLLLMLEGRALPELGAFFAALPMQSLTPRGDGHPVLVLPGLVASDISTRPLRGFLRSRGYAAYGWNQGRNFGPRAGVERGMLDQIAALRDRYCQKVSLVGWSLGGIYARQLAKAMPDDIRQVITLGSPFAGSPRATNAWRIYELASGKSVDDRDAFGGHGEIGEPPPVPSTAIFSRTDGVCAWRNCVEPAAPLTDNIEVHASHLGLGHHPAVVYAVADRLAQADGAWRPFERSGWRALVYPDPARR